MKVHSLSEARDWFLENRDAGVLCVKDGVEQFCASYKEAERFYFA